MVKVEEGGASTGSSSRRVTFRVVKEAAKIRRELQRALPFSIAEAPEGEVVRLEGRVVEGETLVAPLTGRCCVYYVATIEEYDRYGGLGAKWPERVRETRCVQFAIEDGTGRAIVDPTDARIDATIDRFTESGLFHDPSPIEVAFLERHGLTSTSTLF